MPLHDAAVIYIGCLSYFYAYLFFRGFKEIRFLRNGLAAFSFLILAFSLLFLPAGHDETLFDFARSGFYLLLAFSLFPFTLKRVNVAGLFLGGWGILSIESLPLLSSLILLVIAIIFAFRTGIAKSLPFLLLAFLFTGAEFISLFYSHLPLLYPFTFIPEFPMAASLTIALIPAFHAFRKDLFLRFASLTILPATLFPFLMFLLVIYLIAPEHSLSSSFLMASKVIILIFFFISILMADFLMGSFFQNLRKVKEAAQALTEKIPPEEGKVSRWPELSELSNSLNFIHGVISHHIDELSHLSRRLDESQKLIGEFLRNVSHEFRTPLAAISGYLSMLIKNPYSGTPKEIEYLQNCHDQTQSLLRMVESLLLLSEVEGGQRNVMKVTCPLKSIFQKVEGQIMEGMKEKEIQYKNHALPVDLHADPEMVEKVLLELMDNAIKFTLEGGSITIHSRIISQESSREFVEISVADTGPGIPPEMYEKIFEAFTQQDGSERRSFRGIGLGLNLAKKLVELHGGRISVDSSVHGGSRFLFTLPLAGPAAKN
ncbi:MAG: HAMP domain-containing sensor histidine kinase [Acidobacteriota bacterium]